ncbi:MAG: hypothetical protein QM696_06900 [Steroidobacteraceae bacterium]
MLAKSSREFLMLFCKPNTVRHLGNAVLVLAAGIASIAITHAAAPGPEDLRGIYRAIPADAVLPGGKRNQGSPGDVKPTPDFAKPAEGQIDSAKECFPVGPFRMMAEDRVKFEIVPQPKQVTVIFEELAHGHIRQIHLDRTPKADAPLTWQGQAVGRWERGALVVTTDRFNDRTWLNAQGVRHSEALRLVEQIRPIKGGILEYTMTAEDPAALQKPYTYKRYYQKIDEPMRDAVCILDYEEGT